jgi:hypothetical protein
MAHRNRLRVKGAVVASVSSIARETGPSGLIAPLRTDLQVSAGSPAGSASDGQT